MVSPPLGVAAYCSKQRRGLGLPAQNESAGEDCMSRRRLSRRKFVASAAATALAAPFVRGAYAAGKLSIGMWDHWVPGANEVQKKIIDDWAAKEKVDVTIDFIPSQ